MLEVVLETIENNSPTTWLFSDYSIKSERLAWNYFALNLAPGDVALHPTTFDGQKRINVLSPTVSERFMTVFYNKSVKIYEFSFSFDCKTIYISAPTKTEIGSTEFKAKGDCYGPYQPLA